MTSDKPMPNKSAATSDKQKAREERLAAALRANLQRRKTQSRGQTAEKSDSEEK